MAKLTLATKNDQCARHSFLLMSGPDFWDHSTFLDDAYNPLHPAPYVDMFPHHTTDPAIGPTTGTPTTWLAFCSPNPKIGNSPYQCNQYPPTNHEFSATPYDLHFRHEKWHFFKSATNLLATNKSKVFRISLLCFSKMSFPSLEHVPIKISSI